MNISNRVLKSLIISIASLVITFIDNKAFAETTASDFSGDSISDTTFVNIQTDASLSWSYANLQDSTTTSLGNLGKSGDHIILANWRNASTPQLGVVSLSTDKKQIIWKIIDEQGQTREKTFGKAKDTIISGADFNGNGIADAAIARLSGNKVIWRIWPDIFFTDSTEESAVVKIQFGAKGDRVFFASVDGVSDWLALVGKNKNRSQVRYRNFASGETRTHSFAKFSTSASRPRPFPIKNSAGIDVLGFEIPQSSGNKYIFTSLTGDKLGETAFSTSVTAVVGNFNNSIAGEEVGFSTTLGFDVFSPANLQTVSYSAKTGIAIDEININQLSTSANNGGNTGGNTGGGGTDNNNGGGTDTPPPPPSSSSCQSIQAWPSSHIYKTIGSNHFTDIRRNTSGVIVKAGGQGPFPNCIDIIDTQGNVVAKMGSYPPGAGWAARLYAGIGCGAGTPYNGAKITSLAQANTGSSSIYANFGSVCYGPIDASRCLGSSSC